MASGTKEPVSPTQDDEAEPEPRPRSRMNSIFAIPMGGMRSTTPRSLPIQAKVYKWLSQMKESIDPQGQMTLCWQLLVLVSFLYSCWTIPLRAIFPYQTPENNYIWFGVDYVADFIYLLDMVVVRPRLKTLVNGFWLEDIAAIRFNYLTSVEFRLDLLSLLPLDLLYLVVGVYPLLRLPRLLKFMIFDEFFNKMDRIAHSPYIVRIVRTMLYMQYLIHLNCCAYYAYSAYKGIGINTWVYDGVGNAYIRCYLFALKTATSIGRNPKPTQESEYIFMTCSWLTGVFVFALLIGQVRDILSTASQVKREYQNLVDRTQAYLHRLHVPKELEDRVRLWFDYSWQSNNGLDESAVLELLPKKMKSDLAFYVHYHTLSKVQLFKGLDHDLLRDLVLKLKPVLFLPGDYVCKKGEVGKEMFIVNDGEIEVLGGAHGEIILATLGDGCVFGEVSLLALAGGNRRTADVRAKGYSYLFVLNKFCLQETVKEYPEAQQVLQRKARKLMKTTARRPSVRSPTPATQTENKPAEPQKTESNPKAVADTNDGDQKRETAVAKPATILRKGDPGPSTASNQEEPSSTQSSTIQSSNVLQVTESTDDSDARLLSKNTFNQIVKLMQEPIVATNREADAMPTPQS